MVVLTIIILLVIISVCLFFRRENFGSLASGERQKRIQQSPHYKNGAFQNLSVTPELAEGTRYLTVMKEFFFNKSLHVRPPFKLPSVKNDLWKLDPGENLIVWFGHSSYFMQIDGKKILVDPIFSGNASPVKITTKSYKGSDVYAAADIPEIDFLFISHDHWDHLDHDTISKLRPKIKRVITGLGTGAHFERWGYNKDLIFEQDWFEEVNLDEGFIVNTTPCRHFSGRGLKRNQSLWMSFVFKTPTMKIFMGGDSGYDAHYAEIGRKHGPFDLAILECGQYNKNWKYIHMMPEEIVKAAEELGAKTLLPVHWSKFALAQHDWDEPITRLLEEAKGKDFEVLHPMIGELVDLKDIKPQASWWQPAE